MAELRDLIGSPLNLSDTAAQPLAASGSPGTSAVASRSDHVHPLPTPAAIGAAPTSHTHTASQISDSTLAGRALLTAADAAAQRLALGVRPSIDVVRNDGGNALGMSWQGGGNIRVTVDVTPFTLWSSGNSAQVLGGTVTGQYARWNQTTGRYEAFDLLGSANTWSASQNFLQNQVIGNGTTAVNLQVQGSNSGEGGGSFIAARIGSGGFVYPVAIGNRSAIFGGAYNPQGVIWSTGTGAPLDVVCILGFTINGNTAWHAGNSAQVQAGTTNGQTAVWNQTTGRYEAFDLLGAANTWTATQTFANTFASTLRLNAADGQDHLQFGAPGAGSADNPLLIIQKLNPTTLRITGWNGTALAGQVRFAMPDGVSIDAGVFYCNTYAQLLCKSAAGTQISTTVGAAGALEAQSRGSGGTAGAAFMSFHRPNNYAVHFGLDTDNQIALGGWSMGANRVLVATIDNDPGTLNNNQLPVFTTVGGGAAHIYRTWNRANAPGGFYEVLHFNGAGASHALQIAYFGGDTQDYRIRHHNDTNGWGGGSATWRQLWHSGNQAQVQAGSTTGHVATWNNATGRYEPQPASGGGTSGIPVIEISTNTTLSNATHLDRRLRKSNTISLDVTAPAGLPVGFSCILRNANSTGVINVIRGSGVAVRIAGSATNGNAIIDPWGDVLLSVEATDTIVLTGTGVRQ